MESSELEECIKDAVDVAMSDHMATKEYKDRQQEISIEISSLISELSDSQSSRLRHIMDLLSMQSGLYTAEAYKNGAVAGIALSGRVIR